MGDLPSGRPSAPPDGDVEVAEALRLLSAIHHQGGDNLPEALPGWLEATRGILGATRVQLLPGDAPLPSFPEVFTAGAGARGAVTTLGAPVHCDDQLAAMLEVTLAEDGTTDRRRPMVQGWACAIASALGASAASAAHRTAVENLRMIDPLTALPNRASFDARLSNSFDHVEPGQPLVLAFVDVNAMRTYNDAHGYTAGDLLLSAVGELLREITGELRGAFAARMGGDEFSLLAFDHPLDAVVRALQRLHARAVNDLRVSLGSGVARHEPGDGLATPSELLRLADIAQHRAKLGRSAGPVVAEPEDREALTKTAEAGQVPRSLASVTELQPRRRLLRDRLAESDTPSPT